MKRIPSAQINDIGIECINAIEECCIYINMV